MLLLFMTNDQNCFYKLFKSIIRLPTLRAFKKRFALYSAVSAAYRTTLLTLPEKTG